MNSPLRNSIEIMPMMAHIESDKRFVTHTRLARAVLAAEGASDVH